MPNTREKLEVIAHLGEHITYKEDIGICYDSALAKVIEDAYMTLKNGVTVNEWISVKDRLPKPYVDVITLRQDLISQNYHACGLEYITLRGEAGIPAWSKDHLTWKNKVTHWMPLPQPPKGE